MPCGFQSIVTDLTNGRPPDKPTAGRRTDPSDWHARMRVQSKNPPQNQASAQFRIPILLLRHARTCNCRIRFFASRLACMEMLQETPSSSQPQTQPEPAAQAAAAAHYFASRAAAAAAAGLLRTDREHLSDLEHKLLQARQRFLDLKKEKCNASSKGCGCGCCSHGYVRSRDLKATSIGPDSRSVSETSHLPPKKTAGGRQHLTRSSVKSLSSQDTSTMGVEHGNAEGLLLAVDKFLSMK